MLIFFLIVVLIALLILVHEAGHFFAARLMGVRVEEFSIGFGKVLTARIRNGVQYSLRLLPFGGFVRMYGEEKRVSDDPQSFSAQPARKRFVILVAGVSMNIIAGWLLFSASAAIGIPTLAGETDSAVPVSIIAVSPDSPAEQAGLRFGDRIRELRADDMTIAVDTEEDVIEFMDAYRGEEITIVIARGETTTNIAITPRATPPEGEGPLGVSLARLTIERVPLYLAPIEGAKTLYRTTIATFQGFGSLIATIFTEGRAPAELSGPVGIFFFGYDLFLIGASYFLQFAGIISVNLAIINLLPIPVLDGGWVLFLAIEKIRGARLSESTERRILAGGIAFLASIMLFATYHDILKNGPRIWDGIKMFLP
ncbi:MAG: M50 family metallopeptidase [Patescibacteria group bacterium]